jgi:hypothetical protein
MNMPSFCWHCGGPLARDAQGKVIKAEVSAQGALHDVHRACADAALAENADRTLTAAPEPDGGRHRPHLDELDRDWGSDDGEERDDD